MSGFLSLMGWTFLPDLATRFLQSTYYGITLRAGSPRPQPGQPRFAEHYRRIYIFVVCAYLLFTIYEADWELQRSGGDFYSVLGVAPDANVRDIKRRYRQLSAVMHPDKGGPYDAETYIRVQTAHETLSDDVRRFAYDRFGPEMLRWRECTVVRDFVMRGAKDVLGYYGIGALAIYALPKLGYFQQGMYWRWAALASLLVFELHAITRPAHPWFLTALVNPLITRALNPVFSFWAPALVHPAYLPFQAVALSRKLSITLTIALNQVVPYLTADTRGGRVQLQRRGTDEARVRQSLDELERMVHSVDENATRAVKMELAPFAGDPRVLESLRDKMRRWLVDNTVRNEPMTRDALQRTIARRRQDAPAGAQGNGVRIRKPLQATVEDDA
ncbi:putative chaperone protein [Diaporthe ampelina]|uniref:Putative chaperone protein n=1 Tax=Diaporthe ampelina TaxID=1214573 RepID=A0A0G2FJT2_9PEZI|nr:putative chaperone protein [Diaporthe ampelina]